MVKKASFDLNSLDTIAACNKPFEVEIKDVHGNPTGFFISVLGRDSDVYRKLVREEADAELRQQARGKREPESIDKIEDKNLKGLVAATVSWRFGESKTVPLDGEELECTPANARKVYERLLPVRNQVQEAIANVENFMSA